MIICIDFVVDLPSYINNTYLQIVIFKLGKKAKKDSKEYWGFVGDGPIWCFRSKLGKFKTFKAMELLVDNFLSLQFGNQTKLV